MKNKGFVTIRGNTFTSNIHPKYFTRDLKHKDVLDKGCRKAAREMLKHFKKDGWDLALNEYVSEILAPIVGKNAQDYIRAKLLQIVSKKYPKACIKYGGIAAFRSPFISKGGRK